MMGGNLSNGVPCHSFNYREILQGVLSTQKVNLGWVRCIQDDLRQRRLTKPRFSILALVLTKSLPADSTWHRYTNTGSTETGHWYTGTGSTKTGTEITVTSSDVTGLGTDDTEDAEICTRSTGAGTDSTDM